MDRQIDERLTLIEQEIKQVREHMFKLHDEAYALVSGFSALPVRMAELAKEVLTTTTALERRLSLLEMRPVARTACDTKVPEGHSDLMDFSVLLMHFPNLIQRRIDLGTLKHLARVAEDLEVKYCQTPGQCHRRVRLIIEYEKPDGTWTPQ